MADRKTLSNVGVFLDAVDVDEIAQGPVGETASVIKIPCVAKEHILVTVPISVIYNEFLGHHLLRLLLLMCVL